MLRTTSVLFLVVGVVVVLLGLRRGMDWSASILGPMFDEHWALRTQRPQIHIPLMLGELGVGLLFAWIGSLGLFLVSTSHDRS